MVQTVLLTGTSGFIALHILKKLLEEGEVQVRGTVRSTSNDKKTRPIKELVYNAKYPVELVEADLMSDSGWAEAVKGCDYVLHTASPFYLAHGDAGREKLVKPAVEGTLRVLRECAKPGSQVKRVVLTSSIAAVAFGVEHEEGYMYSERDWTNPDSPKVDPYTESKTRAEKAAWDFVENNRDHRFELCTINPGMVFGETLGATGTSVDLVKDMVQGKMPMLPHFNMPAVDVHDVAQAHIEAMRRPLATGKRFVLYANDIWLTEMAAVINKEFGAMGYSVAERKMPHFLAYAMSFLSKDMDMIYKGWGVPHPCDNTHTREILGIDFKSVDQSIVETIHCLIEKGLVEKKDTYIPRA
ncbi:hypothetical protein SARC_03637 [Sphaeroforma arctica JP610]|uniref:NAD-dependent epimerase/dehydratase domain-containing protein n=1 Tax=Sphaeroforma arctica JP610 TaxID=667725 RepID=A0A0L0G5E4_9EUKA|nr:hypothetical protein SARC_03637 [Sphaeroforma arctica JP610]KNC84139.1 hypothetical protein SARC_03637 [Sphaeroforma arctica JP610]|eukprot:XP_014158041.1 hypothetical protein SARC_03637 [Sphaeroforma arctica JP610]